jgi:hypothetical protein
MDSVAGDTVSLANGQAGPAGMASPGPGACNDGDRAHRERGVVESLIY